MLERLFGLQVARTNVRTEMLAGLTTFMTMAYILFVQPQVLSVDFSGQPTGLNPEGILLATCVVSGLASLAMGFFANLPVALAPGMGENFFFISVVMALGSMGVPNAWQTALGIVVLSGILFVLLSALQIRKMIIESISPSLTNAMAVGIGLFIAFIGLRGAGLVVADPTTCVKFNVQGLNSEHLLDWLVFWFGFLVTSALLVRRVRGAILWGLVGSTLVAVFTGAVHISGKWFGLPDWSKSIVGQVDISGLFWSTAVWRTSILFILIFLFMDLFDTMGTLLGVAEQAGLMRNNKLPRATQALLVDSGASVVGAIFGTSTVTSYIESAAGVEVGGRTGLTAVTTGLCFFCALFFSPLIIAIAQCQQITAPALVIVGSMMMRNVKNINWADLSEGVPAFVIILGIPLTYSIANGISFGLIVYPLVKLLGGRGREVNPLLYILAPLLIGYYLLQVK